MIPDRCSHVARMVRYSWILGWVALLGCQTHDTTDVDPPVVITTPSLPDGGVAQLYAVQLEAAGGTPPYTWFLDGTVLPRGLTLSTDGRLAGTPEVAGHVNVSVQAASGQNRGGRAYSLLIKSTMVIEGDYLLPPAPMGECYEYTFTVRNGVPPLQWSVAGGGVPLGLTLNGTTGVLSGVGTEGIGSAVFALHVRSPLSNQEALKDFEIRAVAGPAQVDAPLACQFPVPPLTQD